jgi:hypothetical protein
MTDIEYYHIVTPTIDINVLQEFYKQLQDLKLSYIDEIYFSQGDFYGFIKVSVKGEGISGYSKAWKLLKIFKSFNMNRTEIWRTDENHYAMS